MRFLDWFVTKIAERRAYSIVKKLSKDDPSFAEGIKKRQQAQKDLQKSLDKFIDS